MCLLERKENQEPDDGAGKCLVRKKRHLPQTTLSCRSSQKALGWLEARVREVGRLGSWIGPQAGITATLREIPEGI